jgi:hypothetical protein
MVHFILIFLLICSAFSAAMFVYLAIGSITANDYGLGITSFLLGLTAVATAGLLLSAVL